MIKKRTKVLVVDDEEVIRGFLSRFLSLEGFDVKVAQDGLEAIEIASQAQFEIIFLDLKMPKMDGVETFRELKKIAPNAKYIMMTGYSLGDLLSKLDEDARLETFITKPFDINEIIAILKEYIRQEHPQEAADILIVETQEVILNSFKDLFQNYNITTVKTAQEALALINKRDFALILSDIALADMSGADLYSKIQEIKPNSKIILTTEDVKKTKDIVRESLYRQVRAIMQSKNF